MPPGIEMKKTNLTPTQKALVQELGCMGLVFDLGNEKNKFYSSYLTQHLNYEKIFNKKDLMSYGYIIIETTFYLYAYTESKLQIKLLKEICQISYKFRNMIRGFITKKKIIHLLENGINAKIIINFLKNYAHPKMRINKPILPINVTNQIKLWSKECGRLSLKRCFFVCGFSTKQEFELFKNTLEETEIPILKTNNFKPIKKVLKFLNNDDPEQNVATKKQSKEFLVKDILFEKISISKFHLLWHNQNSLRMCLTQKGFKILKRIRDRLRNRNIID